MNKQIRDAANLLPKPIKPLKQLMLGGVIAAIRRGRDSVKRIRGIIERSVAES